MLARSSSEQGGGGSSCHGWSIDAGSASAQNPHASAICVVESAFCVEVSAFCVVSAFICVVSACIRNVCAICQSEFETERQYLSIYQVVLSRILKKNQSCGFDIYLHDTYLVGYLRKFNHAGLIPYLIPTYLKPCTFLERPPMIVAISVLKVHTDISIRNYL